LFGQMGLGTFTEHYLTPRHLLPPSHYIFASIDADAQGDHAVARLVNISGPGDYNHDGAVDAADYLVWRKTDGSKSGYDTWRANFGQTGGSGAGASANAAVPEPATLVMLMLTAVVAVAFRRRRITNRSSRNCLRNCRSSQAHVT